MADLLERAQQLVTAGPYDARPSEVAAVHAAIYPNRDAVCQTCRSELGVAYFAIKRWADQQHSSSTLSTSSTVNNPTVTARFHSDQLIYTPHGLGIAYSNANLTDKAARDILKADPDAAQHFSVLPAAATEGEDEQPLTSSQAAATEAVAKTEQAQFVPAGFDYAKLASAMLDEVERRNEQAQQAANEADEDDQQPNLTATAGGEAEAELEVTKEVLDNGVEMTTGTTEVVDEDHDEKPVRLSRMNKEQLVATYRAELNLEPVADLTNDQLRDAIAEHRAGQADPE